MKSPAVVSRTLSSINLKRVLKVVMTMVCFLMVLSVQGQNTYTDGVIELGKTYKNYMFMSSPSKDVLKQVTIDNNTDSLNFVLLFIIECTKTKNKVLKDNYLKLPSDQDLRSIYIVIEISENLRKEGGPDNKDLVDSLLSKPIERNLLIDNYYRTIFTANGNKNKPFDLSKYDFNLKAYDLKTDEEQGIFFIRCMAACGSQIWGYLNIPKPPNTKKAFGLIKKFPKFNGQYYFTYTDLYFDDFIIEIDDSSQSYKAFFIDKYYDLLLNHFVCLVKEGESKKDIQELLLSSVLKDEKLYKYTTHKKTLEKMFAKQK